MSVEAKPVSRRRLQRSTSLIAKIAKHQVIFSRVDISFDDEV